MNEKQHRPDWTEYFLDIAKAVGRLPKVEGHGGEVSIGRDLNSLLNVTDRESQKRGDQVRRGFLPRPRSCAGRRDKHAPASPG